MIINKACLYPHTVVDEKLLLPLSVVFETLVCLQPTETFAEDRVNQSPLAQRLSDKNRLKYIAIAPLEEDLERFTSLVYDLNERGEEYIQQLASLSLAHFSASQNESKQNIISFLTNTTSDSKPTSTKSTHLWQARLYLKLAELYDQKQNSISDQLSNMLLKQDELFSELRAETDSPFLLTEEIAKKATVAPEMMRQRLKAWSQLLCYGQYQLLNDIKIFITDQPNLFADISDRQADSIFEQQVFLSMNLPQPETEAGETGLSSAFTQEAHSLLGLLLDTNTAFEDKQKETKKWNQQLKTDNRAKNSILFQLVPKDGVEIFRSYCDEKLVPNESEGEPRRQLTLLGLLQSDVS